MVYLFTRTIIISQVFLRCLMKLSSSDWLFLNFPKRFTCWKYCSITTREEAMARFWVTEASVRGPCRSEVGVRMVTFFLLETFENPLSPSTIALVVIGSNKVVFLRIAWSLSEPQAKSTASPVPFVVDRVRNLIRFRCLLGQNERRWASTFDGRSK